jgi:hypothetical protein
VEGTGSAVAGQAPGEVPAAATATYTVQHQVPSCEAHSPEAGEAWVDIATVTVPARSHRRKVVGLALAQSGVRPEVGGDPLRLRVLDAGSAHVTEVAAVQRDPELEIR